MENEKKVCFKSANDETHLMMNEHVRSKSSKLKRFELTYLTYYVLMYLTYYVLMYLYLP